MGVKIMVHILNTEEVIAELQQEAYEVHVQHVSLINKIKVSGEPATKDEQEALALYEQQLDAIAQDIDSLFISNSLI